MTSAFAYEKAETLLKVEGLTVAYDKVILRDVNFEIRDVKRPGLTQGQKVALLAPSGMGKTKLFKRIAGLEKPTSGQVLIGVDQKPVKAGMVGIVPQNYLLFDHYTIMQTLMVAAGMRDTARSSCRAKALGMLHDFGMEDKANCYPQQLSGGQRQRVSIAEQLLSSNHFLLMDEPFSGLDILMKKVVCDTIDTVAARDELNTIIFSTHDVESAVMIADTIIILGRDKQPGWDGAGFLPGARVQHVYDLIELGLAWTPDIDRNPQFGHVVAEIKAQFQGL